MRPELSKKVPKLAWRAGHQPAAAALRVSILAVTVLLFGQPVLAQDAHKANESDKTALQMEADSIEKVFTNTLGKLENQKGAKSSTAGGFIWMLVGGGLLGLVVLVRYVPGLLEIRDAGYQARVAAAKAAGQVMPDMAAEEKAFSAFAATFNCGPVKSARPAEAAAEARSERAVAAMEEAALPPVANKVPTVVLAEFSAHTTDETRATPLSPLRQLLQELSAVANPAAKDDLLKRAVQETQALKTRSESPEHTVVWKMAAALEALLNQLIIKPRSVNPSTLRTANAALDLIEELGASQPRPDLADCPPIRVLAVDDDPISRHAIAFTLKKALALPELASNGPAGLELATQNAYDAIFLDILMPEMNGFDLCVKIRQTELNRATPIVFITSQNDFSARSRSSVAGGQDLIAKPFLTFEVALKALTLMIQHRLRNEPVSKPETSERPAEELAAVS